MIRKPSPRSLRPPRPPAPRLRSLPAAALLLLAGLALGQPSAGWRPAEGDDRFAGPHAVIGFGALEGSEAGELRVGCAADDPSLPALVLTAERDLGAGPREVYARVLGIREASTRTWRARGSELELGGFDAALLLTEVAAASSSRALFLRLEGPGDAGGGAWSVPLEGLWDAFGPLPCARPYR